MGKNDKMSQKQKIISTYQQKDVVECFDKERNKYIFQRYKHKIEADFLKDTIKQVKHDKIKVLDVGCGTGRMLPEVFSLKKEIKYVGLDTSKEMIKILKEKAKKLNVKEKVKIKIGDASKIPFKDESFDVVYSFHLLWHLPKENQKEIIEEMVRVCKKKGFIVFDALNKDFLLEKLKRQKTEGIYKLSLNEVKEFLKGKNFDIEKLCDVPIKNKFVYSIFNIINYARKLLPSELYHMIFFRVRK